MSQTQIADFIRKFFDMLNKKEFDTLKGHLTPGVVFHFPGTSPLHGPQKVTQLMRIIYRKYPDLTFHVQDIIAQEDKIAVTWENAGRDSSGKPYNNQGVTIMKIHQGKISYLSDYFKDTSFRT